jgi:hypothetical protein
VVGAHHPLVVQAQAASQIKASWQRAKIASTISGRMRETQIVIGAEALQHGIGLQQSGGLRQAQFADQPILASAPSSLDAAVGVSRGLRRNVTVKNDDFALLILIIRGADMNLN